ncbi:MAG TPA: hypothetical protein VIV58_07910, partial [Kofleriaceae bacterium]
MTRRHALRILAVAAVLAACGRSGTGSGSGSGSGSTTLLAATGPLRIGVTLHPYYSWTANIIAGVPGAE